MGKLTLVAGPIGNLGDLTARAAETLRTADLWFVEDSRVSAKLLGHLGVSKPMRVLNEHTSDYKLAEYIKELSDLHGVVLSDGGTPCVSDPGAMLCDLAHESGIEVDAMPGPSAVTTALMLSGFFAQRFAFLGFLPRKSGAMKKELEMFVDSGMTIVMFESPFRVQNLLEACSEVMPGRRYAICREISKLHQQVFRARLPIIPTEKEVAHKGEFTIVLEGRRSRDKEDFSG